MNRSRTALTLAGCFVLSLLVGCMPKMTLEEMKEHMPKKPAELELLNTFVGRWESSGEVKFAMLKDPTPLKVSGHSESKWGPDGWYVVEEGQMTMDGFTPMHTLATWTYDASAKKYRSTWVDNMGSTGLGEATHDPKTGEWKMTAHSYGAMGNSTMKGTIHLVDKDTMQWTMSEHAGLMTVAEYSGTSRRLK